jgi:hypothetical protein
MDGRLSRERASGDRRADGQGDRGGQRTGTGNRPAPGAPDPLQGGFALPYSSGSIAAGHTMNLA